MDVEEEDEQKSAPGKHVVETATAGPLTVDELRLVDAYWRATNYLSGSAILAISAEARTAFGTGDSAYG